MTTNKVIKITFDDGYSQEKIDFFTERITFMLDFDQAIYATEFGEEDNTLNPLTFWLLNTRNKIMRYFQEGP